LIKIARVALGRNCLISPSVILRLNRNGVRFRSDILTTALANEAR
jgi:hypothetical protein